MAPIIDKVLGLRCTLYGYQYSEIVGSQASVYFCGGHIHICNVPRHHHVSARHTRRLMRQNDSERWEKLPISSHLKTKDWATRYLLACCPVIGCGGRTRHRLLANALTLVKELRPGACRVLRKQKKSDKNRTSLLRRQDSNMRPPGYEPGELPTAPLRDIIF